MNEKPLFTVFTPTHNRAKTLHRVFDSLRAQTLRDFEWLVVDDGSTDNTKELVENWIKIADFPVRYIKQDHSGKHIANNRAVQEARGQFFLVLDSDDACTPQALERMAYHWNEIPESDRSLYSGVAGLCSDQHGKIIGERYPADPFDRMPHDRRHIYGARGETFGSTLTEIVRKFPFPEIKGTQFIPEGAVWLAIAKTYADRCVNEIFRIYYVDDDEAGATLTMRRGFDDNAPGRLYYYIWLLNNDLEYFIHSPLPFLKAAVMIPITAYFAHQHLNRTLRSLHSMPAKALVLSALPISLLLYICDRARTWFF
jgi:glycosyltransferase involved in cell wall biosynthesis